MCWHMGTQNDLDILHAHVPAHAHAKWPGHVDITATLEILLAEKVEKFDLLLVPAIIAFKF